MAPTDIPSFGDEIEVWVIICFTITEVQADFSLHLGKNKVQLPKGYYAEWCFNVSSLGMPK